LESRRFDVGCPRGEFVVEEADQQALGVDHPAKDNQPFRQGTFGNCLVDGKDFVSRQGLSTVQE
jgi:hypothetical protein